MAEAYHNDPGTVPHSVTASTRGGLTLAMVRVNADLKGRALFQDISYVTEGTKSYWVAWYYRTVNFNEQTENGSTE